MLPLAFVPVIPPPAPAPVVMPRPVVSPPPVAPSPAAPRGYLPPPVPAPVVVPPNKPGIANHEPVPFPVPPPLQEFYGEWKIYLGTLNHDPDCNPGFYQPPEGSPNVVKVYARVVTDVRFNAPIPYAGCDLVRGGEIDYVDVDGDSITIPLGAPFGSARPEWEGALIVAPPGSGITDRDVPPGPWSPPPGPAPTNDRFDPTINGPRSNLRDLFELVFNRRDRPPPNPPPSAIPGAIPDIVIPVPRLPSPVVPPPTRTPPELPRPGRNPDVSRPSGRRFRRRRRQFIPPPAPIAPPPKPPKPDTTPPSPPSPLTVPSPVPAPPPTRRRPEPVPLVVPELPTTPEIPGPPKREPVPKRKEPRPDEVPQRRDVPIPVPAPSPVTVPVPSPSPVPAPIPSTVPTPVTHPIPRDRRTPITFPPPVVVRLPDPPDLRQPDQLRTPGTHDIPEPPLEPPPEDDCICYEDIEDGEDIVVIRYISLLVNVATCGYDDSKDEWRVSYEPNLLPILATRNGDEADTVLATFEQRNSQTENLCELLNSSAARQKKASLIASGQMEVGNDTKYYVVSAKVARVWVQIIGEIPRNVRVYGTSTSNEEQGKFGNIASCTRTPSGQWGQDAQPGWIWTKYTTYDMPPSYNQERAIRLTMKPGIRFELWDSGVRI